MSDSGPESPTRLPATVKGLSLVSLFNDLGSEMVYPLLPAFITQSLGGGAVVLGALDGAADLASGIVRWISGRWADRPHIRERFIQIGYAAAVLMRPVIGVTSAAWHVIGLRVLDRVGKGLRSPARDALIARVTPAGLRGRAFGFHRGADHLGAVLGAVAAWALLAGGSTVRSVILWSAVPGIGVLVVLRAALRRAREEEIRPEPTQRMADHPRASELPGVGDVDAVGFAFWVPASVLIALVVGRLPETLLLLRLQDLGTSVHLIPLVWGALHVVRSAAAYPGGWFNDRVGAGPTALLGGLLLASTLALFAWAATVTQGMVTFLAFGLASGLMEVAERTLVVRLAPVHTGRAFGAFQGALAVSALPVALLYGLVYQAWGSTPALVLAASVIGLASALWQVVGRRL